MVTNAMSRSRQIVAIASTAIAFAANAASGSDSHDVYVMKCCAVHQQIRALAVNGARDRASIQNIQLRVRWRKNRVVAPTLTNLRAELSRPTEK